MAKIAIIRIKGKVHIPGKIDKTLDFLKIKNKNNCAIIEDTPPNKGMINAVKDYVTYGEIDEETIKKMEKRKNSKGVYTLAPPKKGYGRKGTKVSFNQGGALGNRKEKIKELIERMI